MHLVFRTTLLGLALLFAACTDKDTGDTDPDSDTEVDTDTDVGSDSDTDSDTDGDTDPDSDTTSDCTPTASVEVSWEACHDGIDNDCDGFMDDNQVGCSICPPLGNAARSDTEVCNDGIDNDCDGFADCRDFACFEDDVACPDELTDALCSDGFDNDGDLRIDCLSRECLETDIDDDTGSPEVTVCDTDDGAENTPALCSDTLDNDGDNRSDCDDDDCADVGYCNSFETDETCSDGVDNDGDALIDCDDFRGCSGTEYCSGEGDDTTCADGVDNDNDGAFDCEDRDCYADPAITVCSDVNEICDNSIDDDGDGLADCLDPECGCLPPSPSAAGDVIVTEFLAGPTDLEFIELYNTGTEWVNVGGCILGDRDSDNHELAGVIVIEPGEYATFVRDEDEAGFTADYEYSGSIPLANGGDEVVLTCDEVEIDGIAYGTGDNGNDATFPTATAGASAQLAVGVISASDPHLANDTGSAWCLSTATYNNGANNGTPGTANTVCAVR